MVKIRLAFETFQEGKREGTMTAPPSFIFIGSLRRTGGQEAQDSFTALPDLGEIPIDQTSSAAPRDAQPMLPAWHASAIENYVPSRRR